MKLQQTKGGMYLCRMCRTAWIFNRRLQTGICTRCEKTAVTRNDLQIEAKRALDTTEVEWVGDWPGILHVSYDLDGHRRSLQISYAEASRFPDLITYLAVERRRMMREIEEEQSGD